jgi:type II secretory pathway component GspD/PulD (secretin)
LNNAVALTAIALMTVAGLPLAANAQQDAPGPDAAKPAAKPSLEETTVKLDVRDARLRDALEMLFKQAKVDFSIEPGVEGFVTMKVTDIPFEQALKLLLRSGSVPLTYIRAGGVYIIRPRPVETARTVAAAPPPVLQTTLASNAPRLEVIQLVYADPADLAQLLNIIILPTGVRFGNTGFAGFGGFGNLGGGGLGGLGAGNGGQNTPRNNNGGQPGGVGTPGGTVIFAP